MSIIRTIRDRLNLCDLHIKYVHLSCEVFDLSTAAVESLLQGQRYVWQGLKTPDGEPFWVIYAKRGLVFYVRTKPVGGAESTGGTGDGEGHSDYGVHDLDTAVEVTSDLPCSTYHAHRETSLNLRLSGQVTANTLFDLLNNLPTEVKIVLHSRDNCRWVTVSQENTKINIFIGE
jgi:hypothetical protein